SFSALSCDVMASETSQSLSAYRKSLSALASSCLTRATSLSPSRASHMVSACTRQQLVRHMHNIKRKTAEGSRPVFTYSTTLHSTSSTRAMASSSWRCRSAMAHLCSSEDGHVEVEATPL